MIYTEEPVAEAEKPIGNCLAPDILAELQSLQTEIGAREALSRYVPLPDQRYVFQLVPQSGDRWMVTIFPEGGTTLSMQFAINPNRNGELIYGNPDPTQLDLLRACLAEIKAPQSHIALEDDAVPATREAIAEFFATLPRAESDG